MSVERLPDTPEAKQEWDTFLRRCPAGTVFMTTAYLDGLGVGYDLHVVRAEGRIVAGMPLTRGIGGLRTNPLYCKYLGLAWEGPLKADFSDYYAHVETLAALVKATKSFDYTFHPSVPSWMPFHWLGLHEQTAYTYVIPAAAKDSWWDAADSRIRRAARRGLKGGVTIREGSAGSAADVASCYKLANMPFTSRGARPLMSEERFCRLVAALAAHDMVRIWFAEETGKGATSAAAVLYDWQAAYFVFNGSSPHAEAGSNASLLAQIIQDALNRGLDFDFEGSMIKPVETFYRRFGGELRPYSRIYQPSFVNLCKRTAIQAVRRFGGYSR